VPQQSCQIALVTGANRGIGFEVCRQLAKNGLTVILGSRDLKKGQEATRTLSNEGLTVVPLQLDVTNQASVDAAKSRVENEFKLLDVLINNAAILYDDWQRAAGADLDVVQKAFETNTLGAWRMCNAFLPLLRLSKRARIVNVSSEAGSLTTMGGGTPAYNLSKAGLNALTRMLAKELKSSRILVNAVCPGWVATDMGGAGGRPVEDGAAGIVWAATLPDSGPTGDFFRDGKPLSW
jgi:NAD(P)-dependent dehydrogenase (short-subunit alcohol dehydrogenase family)